MAGDWELVAAGPGDKLVLRNLLQLYLYDYSEVDGRDPDDHGSYEYEYLDHYWTEEGRHAFLLRARDGLAGCALVRTLPDGSYSLAEFFVMRRHRHRGMGRWMLDALLQRFPGSWTICCHRDNAAARAFWDRILGAVKGMQLRRYCSADKVTWQLSPRE